MIGAVREAPAPVDEMVSVGVTAEVSVVGNCPLGAGAIEGCGAEATTDSSVVGNIVGGVALAPGDAVEDGDSLGNALGIAFIFASASC